MKNARVNQLRLWMDFAASVAPCTLTDTFPQAPALEPIVLLFLVLMLLLDGFVRGLYLFRIGNSMPGLSEGEEEAVVQEGIVISLLLGILRGLGRILDRVEALENILRNFNPSTGGE
jgi:hypothetical protein